MIEVTVHGLDAFLVYWLVTCGVGVAMDVSNLRHLARQMRSVRSGEPDERALRSTAFGYLVMHVLVTFSLMAVVFIGIALTIGALTSGLNLQFSNPLSLYVVVGFGLGLPTLTALTPVLLWYSRWRTLRSLG